MTEPTWTGHPGDVLSAAVDGELTDAELRRVRAHLAECDTCAQELAAIESTRTAIGALPMADATSVVDSFLARHQAGVRTATSFVGVAMLLIGAFGLTGAVTTPLVAPDVDRLVAMHLDRGGAAATAEPASAAASPYVSPVGFETATSRKINRTAYVDGGETKTLTYSADADTVSVFQRHGRLDWESMTSGVIIDLGGRRVWQRSGTPVVLVAQAGQLVVTVVSADAELATTVISQMPSGNRSGRWDRFHDACQRVTEVFGFAG